MRIFIVSVEIDVFLYNGPEFPRSAATRSDPAPETRFPFSEDCLPPTRRDIDVAVASRCFSFFVFCFLL